MTTVPDKICTKCGVPYPKTAKYFYRDRGKLRAECKQCTKSRKNKYVSRNREKVREQYRNFYRRHHKEQLKRKFDEYRTIRGFLISIYAAVNFRCNNPVGKNKCYKGIKCKFATLNEFVYYVVEVLDIDPRGLQIHRIDSKQHYEPGNIEFLTSSQHVHKHRSEK